MWAKVKGYENLYEVNENGIIRSIPHLRKTDIVRDCDLAGIEIHNVFNMPKDEEVK